jgi:hypothetical protein
MEATENFSVAQMERSLEETPKPRTALFPEEKNNEPMTNYFN